MMLLLPYCSICYNDAEVDAPEQSYTASYQYSSVHRHYREVEDRHSGPQFPAVFHQWECLSSDLPLDGLCGFTLHYSKSGKEYCCIDGGA